jgi:archaellum biogenesis ATPase FlaH/DNA primase catalytic subunit
MTKERKMYVRLCKSLDDRGKLIPKSTDVYKYIDTEKDSYISVYDYNEEHKKQFDEAGTIAGITNVTTNKLIFDFDSGNVDEARLDTIKCVQRLKDSGIDTDDINIYFSGGKGFHVVLDTNVEFDPKVAKNAALKVAQDLKTFDSVVYNANRILRLPYTRHPSTGLYKIQLSFDELEGNNSNEIKKWAKSKYEPTTPIKVQLSHKVINTLKLKQKTSDSAIESKESTLLNDLDLSRKPKNISPWKYALEEGFFPPGQRSNALLILAATYKSLGYSQVKCFYALKSAAELQSKRFDQDKFDKSEIWTKIIRQVYSNQWKGGTYAEDTFPQQLKDYLIELGVPRINEDDLHENFVVDISKGFLNFGQYAEKIDENTMKFGIPELDDLLKVQVGHLIGVLGSPGSGKTSCALTLLNNTSKMGIKSFFASYDMAGNILMQKLIQREMRMKPDDLYDLWRNGDKDTINNIDKILKKNYANVSFNFKCGQSVTELRDTICRQEAVMGEEIKLVIVDYLELVRTKSSDPTVSSAEAIQGLREIANDGKVVICLLQPNKMSSSLDEPVLSYNAAKGSSAIAQAVTSMICCYRPGASPITPEDDQFFSINLTKNRMGPLGSADFSWDGLTGRIGALEDIQKQTLAELRERKKIEKSEI